MLGELHETVAGPLASKARSGGAAQQTLHSLLAALPNDLELFGALCRGVDDWMELLDCAGSNGVLGFLYHYLAQSEVEVPPQARCRVERKLAFDRLAQSGLRAALDEVLDSLQGAGIRVVALKGPILGERLYPDPLIRIASDLDILVPSGDLDRATAVLEGIGFSANEGSLERYNREHHHHIHLERPRTPIVELHFRAYRGFGTVVEGEELLARAFLYHTVHGRAAYILSPEDEILYLCVHSAGHRFRWLAGFYELKLFLCRYPNLDWSVVVRRARSLGLLTALSFTCEILRRRFGVVLPKTSPVVPVRPFRSVPATFLLALNAAQTEGSALATLSKWAYVALLCDRPAAAARYLGHTVLWVARRRAGRYSTKAVTEK